MQTAPGSCRCPAARRILAGGNAISAKGLECPPGSPPCPWSLGPLASQLSPMALLQHAITVDLRPGWLYELSLSNRAESASGVPAIAQGRLPAHVT
jgi:hypothetical protein